MEPDHPDFPPYHRNIRIENNIFLHFDYALLFARSVEGLSFVNNRIYKTDSYPPFYREINFYLDGCRKVEISGNKFAPGFPGKNIELHHMRSSDITLSPEQGLTTHILRQESVLVNLTGSNSFFSPGPY